MEKNTILTLDVGGSKIRMQTVSKDGNFGEEKLTNLAGLNLDNDKFLNILTDNINLGLKNENKETIAGIAFGIPGIVDSEKGVIALMPNIRGVRDFALAEKIKNIFNLGVFLINDADAGALGEFWLGKGQGHNNIVYLTLGTGLGSGLIKNGKLNPGSELGHTPLISENEERTCSCWKINCAETFLGTRGLARIYAKVYQKDFSVMDEQEINSVSHELRMGIKAHDKNWRLILDHYVDYLGIFIKNIAKTHGPEIIILGGGIAFNNPALLEALEKKLGREIQISLAKLENSPNIGAAKYAFEHIK